MLTSNPSQPFTATLFFSVHVIEKNAIGFFLIFDALPFSIHPIVEIAAVLNFQAPNHIRHNPATKAFRAATITNLPLQFRRRLLYNVVRVRIFRDGTQIMIKQAIIGTTLGYTALAVRDKLALIKSALTSHAGTGSLINDQLAGRLVSSLCQSDKTFLDIGAHIGSIISETMKRSSPAKIIAIEAMPDKAAKLRRKFPNIELHEYAVSDKEGEANFYVNTKQSGYSSLNKPQSEKGIKQIDVKLNLIDNLISSDDVDVIKIDIEGAELGALRGATKLISDSQPIIMFESGPEESLGFTKSDMWTFLTDHKYDLFIPDRVAHHGKGLTHDGFIDSHVWPRRTTNYIAIPRNRREEIREKTAMLLKI